MQLHGLLLIYRPRRDGRLSWHGWLNHRGHLTTKWIYVNHRLSSANWRHQNARSVCDTKAPLKLQVRLVALNKCYNAYAFALCQDLPLRYHIWRFIVIS